MRCAVLFVLALCVLASACSRDPSPSPAPQSTGASPESTEKELEKLQGSWICLEVESEGKHKKNTEEFQNRLTISGKDMTEEIKAIDQKFQGTIELDPGRQPKRMIFHITKPMKEQAKKVYEVSGDTLRVASFVLGVKEFPPDVSGKGENRKMEIYQRKK